MTSQMVLTLVLLMVILCAEVTVSIRDTFTVQGDVIQSDVRLSPERVRSRIRRESSSDSDTDSDKDIEVLQDNYTFYNWKVFNPDNFDDYWIELEDDSKHHYLSNSHDKAHRANVTFDFLFYGHKIQMVALTTAGFISTSPVLHNKMFKTQYISPYMANYDPSLFNNSTVYFEIIGDKFVVEWRDVYVLEHHRLSFIGPFVFQTVVHKNGTILFLYKKMPGVFTDITVGLAEGMIFDTHDPQIFKYMNYGPVRIDSRSIREGTVVILTPKPTCNLAKDCQTCVTQDIGFTCKWCYAVKRCSDGIDRGAQDWHQSGCYRNATSECNEYYGNHEANVSASSGSQQTSVTTAAGNLDHTSAKSPSILFTASQSHLTADITETATEQTTRASEVSQSRVHTENANASTLSSERPQLRYNTTASAPQSTVTMKASSANASKDGREVTSSTIHGHGYSAESQNLPTTSHHGLATTETTSHSLPIADDQSQSTTTRESNSATDGESESTTEGERESTASGQDTSTADLYKITWTADPYTLHSEPAVGQPNIEASKINSEDTTEERASSNTGLIVVLVLIIVCVIASVCGLFCYAYTHPSSRPAIWLLEHRPTNLVVRWRRGKGQSEAGPTEATPVTRT